MHLNQLQYLRSAKQQQVGGAEELGGYKPVETVTVRIFMNRRAASFEEVLLLGFLKALRVDFMIEQSEVATYRGCKLHGADRRCSATSYYRWTVLI